VADCEKAGINYRIYYNKTTPRPIQIGSWPQLNPGCSVQTGGDWATHWNNNSAGSDIYNKYTTVLPSFINSAGISNATDCEKAGANYRIYSNKTTPRPIQIGSWAQLNPGCSVQSGGDWATHWNTYSAGSDIYNKYTTVLPSFINWTAPEITPSGCTRCSTGVYVCPANKIVAPGLWYNNQASQISSYRLPAYDPETPPINIDGKGYYFRQLKTAC
jgi:hypothetical protein